MRDFVFAADGSGAYVAEELISLSTDYYSTCFL